ncbi:MAG: DUF4124 domain-containing protein [Formivibrio sp.]|nr:DUF4124 domain-containing protein [Formivibrio sp.]
MSANIFGVILALTALTVDARLYRWVDEHGNVQYSDSAPSGNVRDLTELDQRALVRKRQEKKVSASELAQQAAKQKMTLEQERRDNALLQSFGRPEEIDVLRDRQLNAVDARVQTNKLRIQEAQDKLGRLTAQADALAKAGKMPNESLQADIASTRQELGVFDAEAKKMAAEITVIKERAEADKKRLLELRGAP